MKLAVLRHSSYPISSFYRLSTTVTQTIIHITLALPRSCCGLHRNNNSHRAAASYSKALSSGCKSEGVAPKSSFV